MDFGTYGGRGSTLGAPDPENTASPTVRNASVKASLLDPDIPAEWEPVQGSDYSGSGFDRSHITPSAARTNTVQNNSATFLMTNMIPQARGRGTT